MNTSEGDIDIHEQLGVGYSRGISRNGIEILDILMALGESNDHTLRELRFV